MLKIRIRILIFPSFCSDAAERNRLDATTFRLLNFGIILDAVQTVSSTLPITVAIARSSSYLRSFFGLLCLYHAYLTASTSYSALTNYGIPVIKFGVAGPLSAAYLVRFLDYQAVHKPISCFCYSLVYPELVFIFQVTSYSRKSFDS